MNLRSIGLGLLGVLLALVVWRPAAAAESPAVALDLAGHQGMLAYRIVKTYCQIGSDVRMTLATQELKDALAAFEGNLKRLREIGVGEEGGAAVAELERLWPPLRDIAKAAVQRDKAEALFAAAVALQAPAETLKDAMADKLAQGREGQLYLANRQRVLSQRLSALYMLLSWGFAKPEYQEAYREVMSAFEEGLLLLSTAPNRPQMVVEKLKVASKKWEMMKTSNQDGKSEFMPNMAIRMLDGILESIEAVAAAYLNESQVGAPKAAVAEEPH